MLVKKAVVFGLISIFIFTCFLPVVLASAELVGKYAKINGPIELHYIGIARTDKAYRVMEVALRRKKFRDIADNFDIYIVKNSTPVCVLDIKLFKGRAKVLVLEGLQEGATGWVPLSWLPDNPIKARL